MWSATFTDGGKGVGTLTATFDDGINPMWSHSISLDLAKVRDLTPFADKLKAMYGEHVAERQKPDPNAALVDALVTALNGGK